ncbi:hypothetical protein [Desulfolucanica intricata]|uniref:hypothetical protein n=1 Tax=Desulfolucanica intricata TaxID=1285191 RepID=UPI0008372FA2|nr:hypothetical protein [Desulfolucanica intricata]
MKKKILLVFLLLASFAIFANLVTAYTNNILEDPIGNLKASGTQFKVDVITENRGFVDKINKENLPANFSHVPPKVANGQSSSNSLWVFEDQIQNALDKNSELHQKVSQFAKSGKPVVFVGMSDRNKVAEAFSSPIREMPVPNSNNDNSEETDTNKRSYKTVAVWVRYSANDQRDIGQVVIPDHYDLKYQDILEATWIYREGTEKLRDRNNAVTERSKQFPT